MISRSSSASSLEKSCQKVFYFIHNLIKDHIANVGKAIPLTSQESHLAHFKNWQNRVAGTKPLCAKFWLVFFVLRAALAIKILSDKRTYYLGSFILTALTAALPGYRFAVSKMQQYREQFKTKEVVYPSYSDIIQPRY